MNRLDMSMPPDLFLVNLINDKYDLDYTLDDVYFGEREPIDMYGCESVIKMHGRPGGKFSGTVNVYYNRVDLSKFLTGQSLVVKWKTYYKTSEMIRDVRDQFGIRISEDEILTQYFDEDARATRINVSTECMVYRGYIPVYFSGHPDGLPAKITTRVLSGFNLNETQNEVLV